MQENMKRQYTLIIKLTRKWTIFRPVIVEIISDGRNLKRVVLHKLNERKDIEVLSKGEIEVEAHTQFSIITRRLKLDLNQIQKEKTFKIRYLLWDVEITVRPHLIMVPESNFSQKK